MMRRLFNLARSEKGAGALEFALIAPAFFTFIIAIGQFGILFLANAGLKSAVADGARLAVIFPKPSNADIVARISERRFGMDPAKITNPTVTPCTSNGRNCIDIQMSYRVDMNFIFFSWPTQTLTERRRVFVYS